MQHFELGLICLLFAAVSAKWAMELGFRQSSQILRGIAGMLAGPVVVLILYVRLLGKHKSDGLSGARW